MNRTFASLFLIVAGLLFLNLGTFRTAYPYLRLLLNFFGGPLVVTGCCWLLIAFGESYEEE